MSGQLQQKKRQLPLGLSVWMALCLGWALLPHSLFVGCGPETVAPKEATAEQMAEAGAQRELSPGEVSVEPASDAGVPRDSAVDKVADALVDVAVDATRDTASDASPTEPMNDAIAEVPTDKSVPEPTREVARDVPAPGAIDLTWAECRRKRSSLSMNEQVYCDRHYRKPAARRIYGIRWVFLYRFAQRAAWIKARLDLMNARFAAVDISFRTISVIELDKTVLATNGTYDDRKSFRVSQLKYELEQLLGLKAGLSNADALAAWKKKLLDVGVSTSAVNALSLNTSLSPNAFLNRVARAEERHIHIFVAKSLINRAGRTPGGYASLPTFNDTGIGRGQIYLKEQYRADAAAHEAGHFFGLRHTQATKETWKLPFPVSTACRSFLPNGLTSVKAVLAKQLGANYQGALGQPYPPYLATNAQIRDFRALRCATEPLWVRRENTFQKTDAQNSTTWKGFATVDAYLNFYLGGGTTYEKLFSSTVNGRTTFNCGWNATAKKIQCRYGTARFLGDSPLLAGSIAFQAGKSSNLMSYLNNATTYPVRLLAPAQIEMLRLHAHTIERLALKNYAIK